MTSTSWDALVLEVDACIGDIAERHQVNERSLKRRFASWALERLAPASERLPATPPTSNGHAVSVASSAGEAALASLVANGGASVNATPTHNFNLSEGPPSAKRGRKPTHPVYALFIESIDPNGQVWQSCTLCDYVAKGRYSSNLMSHVRNRHAEEARVLDDELREARGRNMNNMGAGGELHLNALQSAGITVESERSESPTLLSPLRNRPNGRQRSSPVYYYFKDSQNEHGMLAMACRLCNYQSNGVNCTNLRKHLAGKHAAESRKVEEWIHSGLTLSQLPVQQTTKDGTSGSEVCADSEQHGSPPPALHAIGAIGAIEHLVDDDDDDDDIKEEIGDAEHGRVPFAVSN